MVRMSCIVFICEIREIRGQKSLSHFSLGWGRSPRWAKRVQHNSMLGNNKRNGSAPVDAAADRSECGVLKHNSPGKQSDGNVRWLFPALLASR